MPDNGKQFVSWEKIAGGFGAVALLVVGSLLGYLLTTTVPRAEMDRLVVKADQAHLRMDVHDDLQDAQIRALIESLGDMKADIARIRALLEKEAKK